MSKRNSNISYFSFARSALKYGLNSLEHDGRDGILVPEYICDVVFHPIQQAGFNVITYPITDTFEPDLDAIKGLLITEKIHALLLVHYFGQPQNLDLYSKFCVESNLWLIEDNSHGHGGEYNGQLLGTIGDIGISSPRKILGIPHGGILHSSFPSLIKIDSLKRIQPYHLNYYSNLIKIVLNYFPALRRKLKGQFNVGNDWSNPLLFNDKETLDYKIDKYSLKHILSANWKKIAFNRRTNWKKWSRYSIINGLNPVFQNVHAESCPWAIPVYAKNMDERNYWLKWGSKHGVNIFPWPTLPEEIINKDGPALARWKRLLCFPLDVSP